MPVTYKIHILEDNSRYIQIDSLIENEIEYILLAQETNPSNICFRKIINESIFQYYGRLSTKEFNEIFIKFQEKNKNLFA